LGQSASKPISNEQIKQLKEKKQTPEVKLDKNGNPLKFSRDLESDWTVKNDKPHYGLKEHTSVDVNNGFFILAKTMSTASVHNTNYFQCCTVYSRHTSQPIEKAFADKAYFDLSLLTKIERQYQLR